MQEPITAKEFFARVEHPLFRSRRWIFRGHSDANWPLLPAAFREADKRLFNPPPSSIRALIAAEAIAICRFYEAAHLQGLPIPEWTRVEKVMSSIIHHRLIFESASWPPPELHHLLAIAQHYGTPTRLLDWTLNPLVAAYFAALDPVPKSEPDHMAVYALDSQDLDHRDETEPLRLVTIPYDINQNARAQKGIFTLYRLNDNIRTRKPIDRRPLDELLRQPLPPPAPPWRATIQKFVIPRAEAPIMTEMLQRRGITASALFPGFAGAARQERECNAREPAPADAYYAPISEWLPQEGTDLVQEKPKVGEESESGE